MKLLIAINLEIFKIYTIWTGIIWNDMKIPTTVVNRQKKDPLNYGDLFLFYWTKCFLVSTNSIKQLLYRCKLDKSFLSRGKGEYNVT